ncbi:phosphoribosylanthranilate isomerase [Bacteroides sp. 214]|uniref:phosphoribosylanthranilate isomerase n=1 Tax=Bacteroides sp. 214 TaxID=2302935 RepID=UPI0013D12CFD|nr:phosphoribosylanthranilate isomerase [Bacteroides sp. 214]NDW12341.1 phosphoribosylanthranilate isomerase [Bacteroides sp. 214]
MINNKLIKVCGMRETQNILDIENLGVDFMGFIFYPKSPRYLREQPTYLPRTAKRVGVFVNEEQENVLTLTNCFSLNAVQLHGSESPQYCKALMREGLQLIKALPIAHEEDLEQAALYEGVCDYLLFDTKCEGYGGSGSQFDWGILNSYKGNTPFLLSGGIDLSHICALKEFRHPKLAGYDINSRFETEPGIKDSKMVAQFLHELSK